GDAAVREENFVHVGDVAHAHRGEVGAGGALGDWSGEAHAVVTRCERRSAVGRAIPPPHVEAVLRKVGRHRSAHRAEAKKCYRGAHAPWLREILKPGQSRFCMNGLLAFPIGPTLFLCPRKDTAFKNGPVPFYRMTDWPAR